MPSGKWDRFKAGFGSKEQQRDRWKKLAEDILEDLDEASAMLDSIDSDEAAPLLLEIAAFKRRLLAAELDFDSGVKGAKGRAISAIEAVESEARALFKRIRAALRAHPSELVGKGEAGVKMLDELVGAVKWKKANNDDKDFVIEAIKARFGLDSFITPRDKTEKKVLPVLYEVLQEVPTSHVLTNDSLKLYVHQARPGEDEAGFAGVYHNPKEDEGGKIVNMLSAMLGSTEDPDPDKEVPKELRPTGSMPMFNATTIHEVGHAVDHKTSTMKTNGHLAAYGGWKDETADSVAVALGEEHGFFAAFADVPRSLAIGFLRECLTDAVPGSPTLKNSVREKCLGAAGMPSLQQLEDVPQVAQAELRRAHYESDENDDEWPEESARVQEAFMLVLGSKTYLGTIGLGIADKSFWAGIVKNAINSILIDQVAMRQACIAARAELTEYVGYSGDDTPWARMLAHDAAKVCRHIYDKAYKGKSGYYNTGRAGATKAKAGTRTYTCTLGNQWYSYLLSARDTGVTAYQFHAPAEWFAELYMLYYGGKLPGGHPAVREFLADLDDL